MERLFFPLLHLLHQAKAENYSGGEYNSAPTGYGSMKQWFSPSLSYIQIPTIHNKVKCGENLQLNVPYTHSGSEPYIKFYYQVSDLFI